MHLVLFVVAFCLFAKAFEQGESTEQKHKMLQCLDYGARLWSRQSSTVITLPKIEGFLLVKGGE